MPPSRRSLQATVALTESPPLTLPASHKIAQIVKAEGNNLYSVNYSTSEPVVQGSRADNPIENAVHETKGDENDSVEDVPRSALVELNSRFRNKIWLKRGGYVVVDRDAFADRDNKLDGEIVNVVREEKEWMKQSYWPREFRRKHQTAKNREEEEESLIGKMPPSESSDEDDGP